MYATYRCTIAYCGTRFHGWQSQTIAGRARERTVQHELEKVCARLLGRRARVTGASRTDAGVHACAQVAHCRAAWNQRPAVVARALNALLPDDVAVTRCSRVSDSFHSRHDAAGKEYVYRIRAAAVRSPLDPHAWLVKQPLDISAMRRAAREFVGRRDFRAIAKQRSGRGSTICVITALRVSQRGTVVRIAVQGNRFLWKMVRNIVGLLVRVGSNRLDAAGCAALLASNRPLPIAMQSAPAHGLFLMRVLY